jgi:hypothetical protein
MSHVRIPDDPQFPDSMTEQRRWIAWTYMNGTKKPVAPWETGHGYPVSWKHYESKDYDDPRTKFEKVDRHVNLGGDHLESNYGYPDDAESTKLGYAFTTAYDDEYPLDGGNIVLVDFDDARDPETGDVHPFVQDFIDAEHTYCQYSNSGDVHALGFGTLPDHVSAIDTDLPDHPDFPDASLEVYDKDRFIAMTGDHIEGTPDDLCDIQDTLNEWADEFVTEPEGKPGSMMTEPVRSQEEIENIDTAESIHEVFDAIQHVGPRDIRLRSEHTETRSDGSQSYDPLWARSESGTRLAEIEDGWVYRKGMIGLGALQVVALEDRIISDESTYPSGDDFWEAVDALRNRGAHIPEFNSEQYTHPDEDTDIKVELPSPSHRFSDSDDGEDREDREDSEAITQHDVYNRVLGTIKEAIDANRDIMVDAIMGSGKTYNSINALAQTDTKGAYFAPRVELYDQAVEYGVDCGIPEHKIKKLPSIKRDCPTWNGEHGEEWATRIKAQHSQGAFPRDIHEGNDDIPCHGDNKTCPYHAKWDFDPDDYQLIVGHYKHSHIPIVTAGRVCIFDEEPSTAFQTRIGGSDLIRSVNTFLSKIESPPVDDFHDLLEARTDHHRKKKALNWFHASEIDFDFEPDSGGVIAHSKNDEPYHAYAPLAVYAMLNAEPIERGCNFERAYIPGDIGDAIFFTTSDEHGDYYVEFRNTPELEHHRSLIALDGTPLIDDSRPQPHKPREWTSALDTTLYHERIMSDEERTRFLEETMNYTFIQTSQYRKPYSSGNYQQPAEDAALLKAVTEKYGNGEPPIVFTARKVIKGSNDPTGQPGYEARGFKQMGLVKDWAWPGAIRGTDRWGTERLAVQLGSSHHGDHEVRRRSAWAGETIDPQGKGNDRDYGSKFGNAVHEQMAENQTAQNILRVGRDGNGATVIIHTSAIPDWVPIHDTGSVKQWSNGEKQVYETWRSFSETFTDKGIPTAEIHELLSDLHDNPISERYVRNVLSALEDRGLLRRDQSDDDGRKHVWSDTGLRDLTEAECADLDLPDVDVSVETESGEVLFEELPGITMFIRESSATSRPDTSRTGSKAGVISDGSDDDDNWGDDPPLDW